MKGDTMEKLDIVGITEFAALAKVNPATMKTWHRRGVTPTPDVRLACGPIWLRTTARRWLRGPGRERVRMLQQLGEAA